MNDFDFERFRKLIYDESGIHFSSSNRPILESRLRERLRETQLGTVADYYELITRREAELRILLDSVTTNLTRFFRNTAHFQSFEYHVLPELLSQKQKTGDRKMRTWSAGCSTGEEPYSIGIVMREILPPDFTVEIVASDLSLKSLMIAKDGYYPKSRSGNISQRHLSKYFEKLPDGYRVRDEIRNMVKFDYHNLKFDSGLRNLDIVFCRNVLIYFDETAQRAVVQKFWNAMSNNAYLFIGHSESLFGMNTDFEFVKTNWSTLYRKIVQ